MDETDKLKLLVVVCNASKAEDAKRREDKVSTIVSHRSLGETAEDLLLVLLQCYVLTSPHTGFRIHNLRLRFPVRQHDNTFKS